MATPPSTSRATPARASSSIPGWATHARPVSAATHRALRRHARDSRPLRPPGCHARFQLAAGRCPRHRPPHAPAWPAIHELALWLETLGISGREVVGMNKGGSVVVRGIRVSMVARRSLGRGHRRLDRACRRTSARPSASSWSWRTASASTTPATRRSSATCASSASSITRTSRSCPSAATSRWIPAAAARAAELLGVTTVVPIHYGTFPVLAGTPDQLREELLRLGLGDVRGPRARAGSDGRLT